MGIRKVTAAVGAALLVSTVAACGGGQSPNQQAAQSLVVDTSFNIKSIDPARQFEFTGSLIDSHLYQSALEFKDGDFSKPVDGLCSYELSEDLKTTTLTLKDTGAKFSDGSPVTADDIVFSYQRLQGIQGNPSFFLDDVTVTKVDDKTVTLVSKEPNPVLPYILPNSSMGIVNSKVVKENGGTTDENDKAEDFINKNSQGSGPYMIESYNPSSEVVFKVNPNYNGEKPKYERVVMRNVDGETQKVNVESGQTDFALDLSPDQVRSLDKNASVVKNSPSTYSLNLFTTASPEVSPISSNPKFQEALRYALDYDKMVELAGEGAERLASPEPNLFAGHVDPANGPQRDLAKAKSLLAEAGYKGEAVPFHYSSDQTVSGVPLDQLAQIIQASLAEADIKVDLKPAPSATQLDAHRSGKQPMGLMSWGADYPDPENYLVFAPGGSIGKRSQWMEGMNPEFDKLAADAKAAGPDQRDAAYQALYTKMSMEGPFIGLIQPVRSIVASNKKVSSFESNSDRSIVFESVK